MKNNDIAKPELLGLPAAPKILLVRLSALGDVIQTLPILPMLRRKYPEASIGWMIDAELAPAIDGHLLVDRIHPCHRRRWFARRASLAERLDSLREMQKFINDVRRVQYDVVLDVQGLFKTALLTYLSGARHKIGLAHGREGSRLFYDRAYVGWKEYFDPCVHHVEHMASLAAALGASVDQYSAPLPPVADATEARVTSMLAEGFPDGNSIVAIAPGTQWCSKRWSDRNWSELTRRLIEQTSFNLLFVGSPADKAAVARVLTGVPASNRILDLSGKTSIPELYAIFRKVEAAIACDSAPLHIAGAAATPYVFGLFGPTARMRTAPIGSPNTVLLSTEDSLDCQPCHKKVCPLGTGECLERLSVDSVFEAFKASCMDSRSRNSRAPSAKIEMANQTVNPGALGSCH